MVSFEGVCGVSFNSPPAGFQVFNSSTSPAVFGHQVFDSLTSALVFVQVFHKYLVDADWSVCAGNWMWVSSSAFEKVLQCPRCICPVRYGRRMDPKGDYVRLVAFPKLSVSSHKCESMSMFTRQPCAVSEQY